MSNILDRFLSPRLLTAGPETLRRARLAVGIALLLGVPNAAYLATFALRQEWTQFSSTLVSTFAFVIALTLLRTRGALSWAANFLVGPMLASILYFGAGTSGVNAMEAWIWSAVTVMIGFLLGGARVGTAWMAVHFGAIVAVVVAGRLGWKAAPVSSQTHSDIEKAIALTVLSMMLFGIIVLYERMKDRMLHSLEQAAERNRLVLENVGDGFLLVGADARLLGDGSAAIEGWFGPVHAQQLLWDYLCDDEHRRAMFRLAWDDLIADVMPREVLLEQLPGTLTRDSRTWRVQYRPVGTSTIDKVVVVVTDISDELAAKAAEAERVEYANLVDRVVHDGDGFRAFLNEAHHLVDELKRGSAAEARLLHTLKGNASLLGAQRLAAQCHELEEQRAAGADLAPAHVQQLETLVVAIERRFAALLGEQHERLRVEPGDVDELRVLVRTGASAEQIEQLIDSWRDEPLRLVVDRLGHQARGLLKRLGQSGDVVVDADHLRVPAGRLDAVLAVSAHVLRNAIDHGFDTPDERRSAGKSSTPTLRCAAHRNEDALVLTIADDGRGIDWERLANKARSAGLAAETHDDLVAALYADGVSTRDTVSELSGRGVGMSAVREVVEAAGGRVEVDSERGRGTTVNFILPTAMLTPTPRRTTAAHAEHHVVV